MLSSSAIEYSRSTLRFQYWHIWPFDLLHAYNRLHAAVLGGACLRLSSSTTCGALRGAAIWWIFGFRSIFAILVQAVPSPPIRRLLTCVGTKSGEPVCHVDTFTDSSFGVRHFWHRYALN